MFANRMRVLGSAAAGALALVLLAGTAKADTTRIFGNWTTSCWTSEQRCAAENDGYGPPPRRTRQMTMSFSRRDGADADWDLSLRLHGAHPAKGAAMAFQVDASDEIRFAQGKGYTLAPGGTTARLEDSDQLTRLGRALPDGKTLTISYAGRDGASITTDISLIGLTAALDWISGRQGRAATEAPFAAAKEPPAPPQIAARPKPAPDMAARPMAESPPAPAPQTQKQQEKKPQGAGAAQAEAAAPAKPAEAKPAEAKPASKPAVDPKAAEAPVSEAAPPTDPSAAPSIMPRPPASDPAQRSAPPLPSGAPAPARKSGAPAPASARPAARAEDMTMDFDALGRAGGGQPFFNADGLPPPPKTALAAKPRGGGYSSVDERSGPASSRPRVAAEELRATPSARGGQARPEASRYAPARPAAIFGQPRASKIPPSSSASLFGDDLVGDKSLDEVILSYLAEDLERQK